MFNLEVALKTLLRLSIVTLLFIVLLTTTACTIPMALEEQTFTNPKSEVNILIAGDASEYKDALRSEIVQHYREKANIRVVNIHTLGEMPADDYQAILIIDTCLAWTRFNPTVLAFLKKPEIQSRVVWFMTANDTEEVYSHNGVDAITAASELENKQRVAMQLIHKIDAVISSGR